MSIFSRRDRNRPSYLDVSLEEYKPRYTSLLDALEHEIAAGSQDVKALRVVLPNAVYEIFHHGGEIKHVYKWNNYFNLGKRLPLRWDEKQLSSWIDAVQGETRNEALLYNSVQQVNEGDARNIFAGLAIRWAAELTTAIQENLEDSTQAKAEYSIHLLEDPQQAKEIAAWDFLQVNSYELCHFADAYNRICEEKLETLHIVSPRDTFALNMEDEEERRGFWENSDECTKVIVDRAPGNYEVEDLYSEELGLRRDMMLTSLEALAFDRNVLINGAPVEFTMEEGLPGLEEFATFSQRDEEPKYDGAGEGETSLGGEGEAQEISEEEASEEAGGEDYPLQGDDSFDASALAFADQGDALGERSLNSELSHTPTKMGGIKFAPVLQDALMAEAFPGEEMQLLSEEITPLDQLSAQLSAVEDQLNHMTEMYAQSSAEYNELSLVRSLGDDPGDEITPSPRETKEEAETKDFANGGFFVLEHMESQRAEINGERRAHLERIMEILATVSRNAHAELLNQLCSTALDGIREAKNLALSSVAPEALQEEEQELNTLDDVEVGT